MAERETKIEIPDLLEKLQPDVSVPEALVLRFCDTCWCSTASITRLTGAHKTLISHWRSQRRSIPKHIELFLSWMASNALSSIEGMLATKEGKTSLEEQAKGRGIRAPSPKQARTQIEQAKVLKEQQFAAMAFWVSEDIIEEAFAFGVERGWFTNPQDLEQIKETWRKKKIVPQLINNDPIKPKTTYTSSIKPEGVFIPNNDLSGPKTSTS